MRVYGHPDQLGYLKAAQASEEQKGVDAIASGTLSAESHEEFDRLDHDEEFDEEVGDNE
jgi:hypothetical protein